MPLSTINLELPMAWQFSMEALLSWLLALVVGVWLARAAYSSVMNAIATLSKDMDTMRATGVEQRSRSEKNADKVTEIERMLAVVATRLDEMDKKVGRMLDMLEHGGKQ